MSTIDTLRANVLNAVRSLLPANVDLIEGRVPETAFQLAIRRPCVVVCYAGSPKREEGPIGRLGVHGYVWAFTVAIVEETWNAPAGSAYAAANIGEILRGSGANPAGTPNLQTLDLVTVRDQALHLRFATEAPQIDPLSATPQGGGFALVQQYETDPPVRV